MPRLTGKQLAKNAGLEVDQALYRRTGDWYHVLTAFPGALLDDKGYLLFHTKSEYQAFVSGQKTAKVKENPDTDILKMSEGISSHPHYVPFVQDGTFPNEIRTFVVGVSVRVNVNRYERDPLARKLCLLKWGLACKVCDFNFGEAYGRFGAGFIHVHHLTPLHTIKEAYTLVPERDLRPVCPNCHAMLHRREPHLEIDELKETLKKPA